MIRKKKARTGKKRASRVRRKTPTPRAKNLSAVTIQNLRTLATQAGQIIPATSFGSTGFCFKKIASEYGMAKYWPSAKKGPNKKEGIYLFFSEVYRRHRITFKKIFRENIARGIERRQNNGNPVLESEILGLSATLKALGVDLERDFMALHLPKERPAIVPPPQEFRTMVDRLSPHAFLLPECTDLFKNGHINESVRKALEKFEAYVQKKSSLQTIGTDLMGTAFSEKAPYICIADNTNKRGVGLQDGFKLLSMGTMGFWRNYLSHGDEEQIPHQDAISILGVVSHMMNVIDSAPANSTVAINKAVAAIMDENPNT